MLHEIGNVATNRMGRHRWSQARTHVAMRACFSLPDEHGGLTPSLSALCGSKTRCDRTFPGKPARTYGPVPCQQCSERPAAPPARLFGARDGHGSLRKGPARRSLPHILTLWRRLEKEQRLSGLVSISLYTLACEALFSATDGAMRACLWPMRPWFRARVRYSRSPLTCMTCLWIEKPVGNATKLPAQDQLRKHSAGVQLPQKSTKRTQTTDKVAENSH